MNDEKFYICRKCGAVINCVHSCGNEIDCCGKQMEELKPNIVDASHEKHIPVVSISGNQVSISIGSELHPMTETHFIEWICVQTEHGKQYRNLTPGDSPKAAFSILDDNIVAVFAYCNIHGLWMVKF